MTYNYRWLRMRFKPEIREIPKDNKWLTISEASKRVGKSRQIIRIWAFRGIIQSFLDLKSKRLIVNWENIEKKLKKKGLKIKNEREWKEMGINVRT